MQGQIEEFLSRPIPEDWQKWGLDRRFVFWSGGVTGDIKVVPRDRVCPAEIWKECLNERRLMTKADAARINAILLVLPCWEKTDLIRFGGIYGSQRGYKRKIESPLKLISKETKSVLALSNLAATDKAKEK